ncbi:MAG: hypothetical protein Q7T71_08740, partial [Herbiconiux sp.]|nr:hypothetical protein [Herbiconiux sp.]
GTPIRLAPATTEGAGQPFTVTLDDARGAAATAGGITTYHEQGSSQATYVQPLADGIRVLTALADASAGEDFDFTLDLPAGSTTQTIPTGDTVLADGTGRAIAALAPAWARDANGAELETGYRWNGATLTQHVELEADTAFPVLLDPKWFYSYDFSTTSTGWPARHPKASDVAVDHLLHGCFNCWFPVAGASRAYPVDGAVMNLNASPFTIIEVPAPVKVQTANGGALQFLATSGHFDGAGSTITFAWYNDVNGYLHLYVHAMIMVDRGPTVNIANSRLAGVTWLGFWKRVADNANGSSGGGGV